MVDEELTPVAPVENAIVQYFFLRDQPKEWRKANYGKYALVADEKIQGVFATEAEAVEEGHKITEPSAVFIVSRIDDTYGFIYDEKKNILKVPYYFRVPNPPFTWIELLPTEILKNS